MRASSILLSCRYFLICVHILGVDHLLPCFDDYKSLFSTSLCTLCLPTQSASSGAGGHHNPHPSQFKALLTRLASLLAKMAYLVRWILSFPGSS